MRLKSKYKLRLLIIFLILLIIFFLIKLLVPKNYTSNYKYKNYTITEQYQKNKSLYKFTITYKKVTYKININHKYSYKRHHINKVSKNDNCLTINVFNTSRYICINNSEYEAEYIEDDIQTKKLASYKNINIYNYNESLYYIWNYNNFIVLSEDKNSTLDIFDNDQYELEYITPINNYLLVADYDQDYYFKKFIFINAYKRTYEDLDLKRELSFDGYITGTYKNYVYLYDNHYDKSFKINPFKNTFYNASNELYIDGNWKKISSNKLSKHQYYFTDEDSSYYTLDNGKLYYNDNGIKILVYKDSVDRIVYQNQDNVYFVSDSKLIYNNYYDGNKLLMEYSEWKFNNKNIYVFDN